MRRSIVAVTSGIVLMGASLSLCSASGAAETAVIQTASASVLEGTTWPIKLTPDETAAKQGEKPFDDSLIFKDGKVTMSACVKSGFSASIYTAVPVGPAWTFATEQVSDAQGTTAWTAEIAGNAVKGTMAWTKKDGTILHYSFEGTKAAAPSAS